MTDPDTIAADNLNKVSRREHAEGREDLSAEELMRRGLERAIAPHTLRVRVIEWLRMQRWFVIHWLRSIVVRVLLGILQSL